MLHLSEKGNYNPNLVWFNKIHKMNGIRDQSSKWVSRIRRENPGEDRYLKYNSSIQTGKNYIDCPRDQLLSVQRGPPLNPSKPWWCDVWGFQERPSIDHTLCRESLATRTPDHCPITTLVLFFFTQFTLAFFSHKLSTEKKSSANGH